MRTLWRDSTVTAVGIAAAIACGGDSNGPEGSLVGTWDLIGFTDGGVAASVSGTVTFADDGNFSMDGTITFPEEPPENVTVRGTFEQSAGVVTLSDSGETSTWDVTFSGDEALLTQREPPPANTITLRRR